ncbi:MAG: hypothetical protein QF511_10070, partial [Rhodospirillales bacterium]|nr:hypothetical protein [Rhodospirillales bacterium]
VTAAPTKAKPKTVGDIQESATAYVKALKADEPAVLKAFARSLGVDPCTSLRDELKAKCEDPDEIVRLRQGSKAECESRDPAERRKERAKHIKEGVDWRRSVLREAIDERRKRIRGGYLVEREIADAVNDHYLTNIVDGLNGWRDRKRYESVKTLASVNRHLTLFVREDTPKHERDRVACRLKDTLRAPEFVELFGNVAIPKISAMECE